MGGSCGLWKVTAIFVEDDVHYNHLRISKSGSSVETVEGTFIFAFLRVFLVRKSTLRNNFPGGHVVKRRLVKEGFSQSWEIIWRNAKVVVTLHKRKDCLDMDTTTQGEP
jgi:hypothetical protein